MGWVISGVVGLLGGILTGLWASQRHQREQGLRDQAADLARKNARLQAKTARERAQAAADSARQELAEAEDNARERATRDGDLGAHLRQLNRGR